MAGSANGGAGATFAVTGDREVTGQVSSGRFCGQPDSYTLYFAARFDRPFAARGTWGGDTAAGTVAGGYVSFDTRNDPMVGASAAISGLMGAGIRLLPRRFPWAQPGEAPMEPLLSRQVLSFSAIWVALNMVVGYLGLEGLVSHGQAIAWQAHLGGYFAGLLLASAFDRLRPRALAPPLDEG